MRFPRLLTKTMMLVVLLLTWGISPTNAVDFESFDFNEAFFTPLTGAVNTANPGNNWTVDANLTDSFADGAGNFRVGKFNDLFAPSHLQIDDVTSGTRFIAVDVTSWEFIDSIVGEGEEIRFSFLDDTTGTSGSTVTAEVRVDRNTDTEAIELRGVAVGPGSSSISNRATLNTVQADPFTFVLELNKTSNTYEVFYKDGTNPSQSLGTGSVAPTRNGNSLRFVVNNNFGSTIDENFLIDRVAVTDTNPLTDLLTLEVNRISGETKLINTSGAAVNGVLSTTLSSDIDAIDPGGISSFSGDLAIGQEVVLSTGSGPWIKNPTEDLRFELNFTGGVTRSANVDFVGNDGERFEIGDLTFDGSLTVADWTIFIAGAETDLSGLSVAQAYQQGDLMEMELIVSKTLGSSRLLSTPPMVLALLLQCSLASPNLARQFCFQSVLHC